MDLLKKIFIIVLLLFPLGEIVRINLGNDIIVKPIDIGVGSIVFLWLILKFKKKEAIKQKYILTPILFFVATGIFSLFINYFSLSLNQFLASGMYLIRWIAYAFIFFVISDFNKNFKKIIGNMLIIIGGLIVGLGYIQYFLYPNLKGLFYLGWDEHMYRMFSTFLDPNFAGAFFVLFFLFAANLFLKKKSTLLGFLLALTLCGIFLTFSRSAIIMFIISSSIFLVLFKKRVWMGLLFGATLLFYIVSSKYFYIENVNPFRVLSSEARIETARNAIEIIQKNLIFGVGFNAYRYAQLRYGLRNDRGETLSHADSSPDNSFLFVLATAGLVGFASYLFLWYRILKQYWFSALVISSMLGIFINSLFINSLFYPSIMLWMWVLLGITEKE